MGMIKRGEIRKSERFNFACTPQMLGMLLTTSQALDLTPSEMLRGLIAWQYNELLKSRHFENLKLEGDENA